MGNSSSRDDDRRDEDRGGGGREGEREIRPEPVVPDSAPRPTEERVDPNIIENLDQPLEDDKFALGVESNYEEAKEEILKKSREEGKQYVWRDSNFPADESSLYYKYSSKWNDLQWKRPHEISKQPLLIKDGIANDDIIQGRLGNCWWLSSVAAVSRIPKYMKRLIPEDQKLEGEEYVGMFHFRFWRFGRWVDVIVDDRLPTYYDRLVFGRSKDGDEFWLPFMEKAYAKLHGTYQATEGGFSQDALEDLTGGMAVVYELGDKTPPHLFRSLAKAFKYDSFATCAIEGSGEREDKSTGLVSAHAYTITSAKRVPFRDSKVKLVRIRNPWGSDVEWKGNWSDSSYLWDEVDQATRDRIGYADKDNGEWWMDFDDFIRHFNNATVCTMGPDFDEDGAPTGDQWYLSKAKGAWIKGLSAGGCRNDVYSFATNPQYYLELREPDDFDPERDEPDEEGMCSVVMGIMQEYRRVGREEGLENLYLGMSVYKVRDRPTRRLHVDHFRYNRDTVNTGSFINHREVSLTAELEPGHYVLVPSTFYADKAGSFLIRIFTEKQVNLEELH